MEKTRKHSYPLEDIICKVEPPVPNGSLYRGEPILSFSADAYKKIVNAYSGQIV